MHYIEPYKLTKIRPFKRFPDCSPCLASKCRERRLLRPIIIKSLICSRLRSPTKVAPRLNAEILDRPNSKPILAQQRLNDQVAFCGSIVVTEGGLL